MPRSVDSSVMNNTAIIRLGHLLVRLDRGEYQRVLAESHGDIHALSGFYGVDPRHVRFLFDDAEYPAGLNETDLVRRAKGLIWRAKSESGDPLRVPDSVGEKIEERWSGLE